jgi:xylitol oxidase
MSGGQQPGNWAGNVTFSAARFHQPASVTEVRRLVAGSRKLKALGTGHSFSPIADTTGDLISLSRLPRVIAIDPDRGRVTVSAGVTYGELAVQLHKAGYALANLGSLPHICVVGACMTGTHGSGDSLGNLATAVMAVELIAADGDIVTLDREASVVQSEFNEPVFNGTVVALGALGVVVSLALGIQPDYDLRQYVYDNLPLSELDEHLTGIFASGYSVSLFTDWRGPIINQVWLKERVAGADAANPRPRWHGARLADGERHPVPGLAPVHCTAQLGVPGPWHERLPHFRLGFTPSAGRELQSEYLVPREQAVHAIHAIDEIRDLVAPVLQISEVRTVAADELWLSPSYRRNTAAFHFTWIDDVNAVMPVLGVIEERLAPFLPRPHWGKLFIASAGLITEQYERLPDFVRLMRHYDPSGKFRNAFLDTYIPNPD